MRVGSVRLVYKSKLDLDHLMDFSSSSTREVIETEPFEIDTGVLDQYGNKIVYTIIKDPIGFLWHDEEGNLLPRDKVLDLYE